MKPLKLTLLILTLSSLLIAASLSDYFEKPQEYPRSGKRYTELVGAASKHTSDPDWLYDLAWAYHEEGMNDDALKYIRRALELKPNMAFLNARAGDIFDALGQTDSAIAYYETALNQHYEYLEVWEKIIELEPEYYANLGLLYAEKADEYSDEELIDKAAEYLNKYLTYSTTGEYTDQCKDALSQLELKKERMKSQKELDEQLQSEQAEEARRKAELRKDRTTFYSGKPYLIGLGYFSLNTSGEPHYFEAQNPGDVEQDRLEMEYYTPILNEFAVVGGYVYGQFFLRGAIHYGKTSSGKSYLRSLGPDTTSSDDDDKPEVTSVNTLRLSVSADYNLYYTNPVLLYIGGQADIGTASAKEQYDNFKGVTLAGAGVGAGVMLRFSDFLFDLGYRRNIVGSSAGGTIALMGMYKF